MNKKFVDGREGGVEVKQWRRVAMEEAEEEGIGTCETLLSSGGNLQRDGKTGFESTEPQERVQESETLHQARTKWLMAGGSGSNRRSRARLFDSPPLGQRMSSATRSDSKKNLKKLSLSCPKRVFRHYNRKKYQKNHMSQKRAKMGF